MTGTVPGMVAWLGLKMLTNWNSPLWRRECRQDGEPVQAEVLLWAFSGLMGGLLSMLFALIAGLVLQPALTPWIAN